MRRLSLQLTGFALCAASLLATGAHANAQQDKVKPAPVTVSPDGTRVARGDGEAITISDPQTNKVLARMLGHTDLVTTLSFSADGKLLASGGKDMRVNLWDIPTGRQILQRKLTKEVSAVLLTPDGKGVIVRFTDRTTAEYDVQTGNEVKKHQRR